MRRGLQAIYNGVLLLSYSDREGKGLFWLSDFEHSSSLLAYVTLLLFGTIDARRTMRFVRGERPWEIVIALIVPF